MTKGPALHLHQDSVGIDLKELAAGRGGVRCRNVRNFAQGLKFRTDFRSKMSVCRHELGVQSCMKETKTLTDEDIISKVK